MEMLVMENQSSIDLIRDDRQTMPKDCRTVVSVQHDGIISEESKI